MMTGLRLALIAAILSGCGGRAVHDEAAGAGGSGGATGAAAGLGGLLGGAGPMPDFSACTGNDTCVLEPVGPCGAGCEPIPLSRLEAINGANVAAYERSKPPTPCIENLCPELAYADLQMQNYYAECIAGHCQALDVRETDLSRCQMDTDCSLRAGTSCCACADDHLIAYASQANIEQAFCAPEPACQANCTPPPLPRFVAAWCTAGHCVVHYPP